MKKKFKAASFNKIDSQGDIFLPNCFSKKRIPVLVNFDYYKPICFTHSIIEEDGVYADIDIDEKKFSGVWYPAIGFTIKKYREENGVRIIEEAELYTISINNQPNSDETIPPI